MKKNKTLIIGVVIFLIVAAVAIWYFFYRSPKKVGEEESCPIGETGTFPDCVAVPTTCPVGFSGTYPDCKLDVCPTGETGTPPDCKPIVVAPNPDTVFANALFAAIQIVESNTLLTSTQRSNARSIIRIQVPKNKELILAVAASGQDLVQTILLNAERFYLSIHGVAISLSPMQPKYIPPDKPMEQPTYDA